MHPRTPGLCKVVLGHEEETFYEMSENRVKSVGEAIGRQMLIQKSYVSQEILRHKELEWS